MPLITKNGQIHKILARNGTIQSRTFVTKNGQISKLIPYKKVSVTTTVTAYAQNILSITASSIDKFIGVSRTSIEKVIGAP